MSLYFKRLVIIIVVFLSCNNKSVTKESMFDELMKFYSIEASQYDLIITIPSLACVGCVTNVQHRLPNIALSKKVLVFTDINTEIKGVDIVIDKEEKMIRTKYWAYHVNIVKINSGEIAKFIEINPNNLLSVLGELENY